MAKVRVSLFGSYPVIDMIVLVRSCEYLWELLPNVIEARMRGHL